MLSGFPSLSANKFPYRFILGILFGSRLMAPGSRLMAHGSIKNLPRGAWGLGDPAPNFLLAMSHEP